MRTTINLEEGLYKKLVQESVEKYGTTRNLSALINALLAKRLAAPIEHTDIHPIHEPKAPMGKIEHYILDEIERHGALLFPVIDPMDYPTPDEAVRTARYANEAGADAILIGGSTGVQGEMLDAVAQQIKENVNVPVVLFPGNIGTVTKYADAVYFMSLLNSRNPYWITGAQMLAAPNIRQIGIEPLPTGYIVIEPGGTVGHVGEANAIPRDKPMLAAALALAAQYMGFRFVISDAGSNPKEGPIPLEMVTAVAQTVRVPYIVAGGIRTPEQAKNITAAGARAIQVGTAFEKGGSVSKIKEMVAAVRDGAGKRKPN